MRGFHRLGDIIVRNARVYCYRIRRHAFDLIPDLSALQNSLYTGLFSFGVCCVWCGDMDILFPLVKNLHTAIFVLTAIKTLGQNNTGILQCFRCFQNDVVFYALAVNMDFHIHAGTKLGILYTGVQRRRQISAGFLLRPVFVLLRLLNFEEDFYLFHSIFRNLLNRLLLKEL